jgi:hypothetical protein
MILFLTSKIFNLIHIRKHFSNHFKWTFPLKIKFRSRSRIVMTKSFTLNFLTSTPSFFFFSIRFSKSPNTHLRSNPQQHQDPHQSYSHTVSTSGRSDRQVTLKEDKLTYQRTKVEGRNSRELACSSTRTELELITAISENKGFV